MPEEREYHETKVKGVWIPIEIWENPILNIYEKNLKRESARYVRWVGRDRYI